MFKRFRKSEKGQGMVEYGLILALVSIVALGALGGIGGKVSDTFDKVVGVVSGGEVILEDEPLYTDEKVQDLVDNQGYIPIATPDELDSLRKSEAQTFGQGTKWEGEYTSGLDKKYIQVADINLSEVDNFEPIGTFNNAFKGIYDGGGYEIKNLTVDKGGYTYAGLFGQVDGATLKNIGLVNVNVTGGDNTGGLVGGQYSSSISNSYATGTVTGGYYTGGLVGYQHTSSSITNSYARGSVTGSGDRIGGLVGFQHSSFVSNSYATGTVNGAGFDTGGLVGYQYESSIENSYATGSVTSTGRSNTGGLVGFQSSSSIENSYATGQVTGGNDIGGLVGRQSESSVTNSYYDTETTGQSNIGKGTGKSTADMKKQTTYNGWDFTNIWEITDGQYPTLR